MNYITFGLYDIISAMGEEKALAILSSFKCSLNPDAEKFLKKVSIRHEKNGISKTYLIFDGNPTDAHNLKGYFTLGVKCFVVNEGREIPKDTLTKMNVNRGVAQAYLLGQIAKADGTERGFGKTMIFHALKIFYRGYKMFGCRTIRLDCKDEPRLINYYESLGFISVGKNHDNALNQMVVIM